MASPRTRSQEPRDRERNVRLADWIAREAMTYLNVVARRAGAPEWQLDDVVQSGIADFLRGFPGPDVREKALAYCGRCVASQASKARRRFARKESHEAPVPEREGGEVLGGVDEVTLRDGEGLDPAEAIVEHERLVELGRRLEELPEDQRAILFLGALGYGLEEIAKLRGLSVRQVRKRVEAANRRLRER
jgi:RNA polymerase sigma factor (sigma-70 family)